MHPRSNADAYDLVEDASTSDVDSVSVGLNVQYYDRFGVLLNPVIRKVLQKGD